MILKLDQMQPKIFDDIIRAVKQLIILEKNYDVNDISFKELEYEYKDNKLVYKIDYKVKVGSGDSFPVYEDLWARIDESDVIQYLREERLNKLLD